METPMNNLFAQLGLPSDTAAIERFIVDHRPLDDSVCLSDAAFWTTAQAAFLREELLEDADWAEVIDALNMDLRTTR
jgi:hypothetical protein